MVFTHILSPVKYVNKAMRDYCTNSTKKYIENITNPENIERNKLKISLEKILNEENNRSKNDDKLYRELFDSYSNPCPTPYFYLFLSFLSISTIGFVLYKQRD